MKGHAVPDNAGIALLCDGKAGICHGDIVRRAEAHRQITANTHIARIVFVYNNRGWPETNRYGNGTAGCSAIGPDGNARGGVRGRLCGVCKAAGGGNIGG